MRLFALSLRLLAVLGCLGLQFLHADFTEDLIKLHLTALGGEEKLAALKSLRAEGRISIGQNTLDVLILAKIPNLVRTEVKAGVLTSVQVFDGKHAPWKSQAGPEGTKISLMDRASSREFIIDAEFYDLFYKANERGYIIESVGKKSFNGQSCNAVRVFKEGLDTVELWLHEETHHILRRFHQRILATGKVVQIDTRFYDYRPIDGVMLPFRMSVYAESRKLHETELDSITPNPELDDKLFTMPTAQDFKQTQETSSEK